MTDEMMQAVIAVKDEADKLRYACIAASGTGALLHLAYDHTIEEQLNVEESILLGTLKGIR